VATGAGVMLVIFPLITLGIGVLWGVLARLTHKASVASITVAVAFPIAVALAGHEWGDIVVISVVSLLVVARHLGNLRRLVTGQEHTLDPTQQRDDPPDAGGQRAAS
jgi:glycerol-3-phosphate acyltransferase PlsY